MKEREISLLDLAVEILLHWRMILVVMLAGAVLAGAFSYAKSYQAAKTWESDLIEKQPEDSQLESLEMMEEELTDAQLQNVRNILVYEALYQNKRDYQERSVLLQMDANHVNRMELTFYIASDSRQKSFDIEKVYENIVTDSGMYEYAARQTGQHTAVMAECITLCGGSDEQLEGSSTFKVKIVYDNKENCQKIASAVVEFLTKQQDVLEKSIGGHQIELLRQSYALTADMDILECQKNSLDDLISMADTLARCKAAFTEKEKKYYEFQVETKEADSDSADGEERFTESVDSNMSAAPGMSIKYVVFGIALTAFAYIFVLFLQYVLSGKICSADQLMELYGIPQFGTIPGRSKQKKIFGFVDQWILSFREHGKRRFSKEEAIRLSAVAVKMAAVKEGVSMLSLVGCNLHGNALEMCEVVKEELVKEGIQVNILNNVLYDAQEMSKLEETKGAVLVERVQSTLYSEICQELELFKRQEIMVLGGIVVE